MEWFETWFDSEYYHKLYEDRGTNEAENFINNLINKLDLKDSSSVLDLACGKGRHSLFLNQKGFHTTGVDLSKNSISAANNFKNDTLQFKVEDMRYPFCKKEFDTILNLFTSFGYFNSKTENLKVLSAIDTMLKDNGQFVIDFMNSNYSIKKLIPFEIKMVDNIEFHLSRFVKNGNIVKQIKFSDGDKKFQFEEKVQALLLKDFENMIQQTGLKIDYIFGNYNLDAFDIETSDRLIIVGAKK